MIDLEGLKAHLKIDGDAEDSLLEGFILEAKADAQHYLERRFEAKDVTERKSVTARDTSVRLTNIPIDGPVTCTGPDGSAVTGFDVDEESGIVTFGRQNVYTLDIAGWPPGAYTFAYNGGMSNDPDYEDIIEPIVSGIVRDLATHRYLNRNTAAVSEKDGDVSVTLETGGRQGGKPVIPSEIKGRLDRFRVIA